MSRNRRRQSTDCIGSGSGAARSAAYPYGVTRYGASKESRQYANAPLDRGVGLDLMGARFYAPDLGVWTIGDPVLLNGPEKIVGAQFGTANPYAYCNLNPVIAVDSDGNFWNLIAGVVIGAVLGGGIEAARQYIATGRVEDWGRVGAAAAGGAVSGLIIAANPAVGLAAVMAYGATAGGAGGITERLIASGGKSAGTVKDVLVDEAVGAVTAGVLKGGSAVVGRVVRSADAPAVARVVAKVAPREVPGLSTHTDEIATWARVTGHPRAIARIEPKNGALLVTDIFSRDLPKGSGSTILAAGLKAAGIRSGQQMVFTGIENVETLASHAAGEAASASKLGRLGANALRQLGLEAGSMEFGTAGDKLSLTVQVK